MAKITPSALITAIQGKWHDSVFQMWKGAIVVRRAGKPRQPQKESRAAYKGIVSDVAGDYDSISAANKTSWACYADLLPTAMSGFNAFLSLNTSALMADHAGLCLYFTAPATLSIPASPTAIAVAYCTGSDSYCVSWATPTGATYYVQAQYSPQVGYSNATFPSWRIASCVSAANLQLSLDGSGYPSGTLIRFRARTLNIYAEPSAWTATTQATKP
jgi:hypothetical protein